MSVLGGAVATGDDTATVLNLDSRDSKLVVDRE
jgi:hypothetical protein